MRILTFSVLWEKLQQSEFTTFRFQRKDKDWEGGEEVKIVYKQRSKDRIELGIAKIIKKEPRWIWMLEVPDLPSFTKEEAIEDGFETRYDLFKWMRDQHGKRIDEEPMNKLTLKWLIKNG